MIILTWMGLDFGERIKASSDKFFIMFIKRLGPVLWEIYKFGLTGKEVFSGAVIPYVNDDVIYSSDQKLMCYQ